MNINKILLTLIVLSVSIISFGQPLVIEVTGDPVFLSSQFNVTEAGSNFNNRVTNTSGSLIAVNSENFWDRNANRIKWEIYIYKSDIYWNSLLDLEIKRIGDGNAGSGSKKIKGGKSWRDVTNVPKYFFKGDGAYINVPVDFRFRNMTVLIPADSYETTIVYTVYER